jgi:Flp pilus assembly pilin Flp
MKQFLVKFVRNTEGQDLIEYALLAATIALGAVAAMQGIRGALQGEFNNISTGIGS